MVAAWRNRFLPAAQRATRVLHATDAEYDPPPPTLPANHHYVGPLIWEGPSDADLSFLNEIGPPWILVTLSTLPQVDEMLLARSAIEALADRPYRVLLTLPPGQPREQLGVLPANVRMSGFLPHRPVWERSALLIRPELTKRPPGTHKDFAGVSENLLAEVSVHPSNPTGFSVETIPRLFRPIRRRSRIDGKHLFSVIAAVNISNTLEGIFGGFLREPRRFVLGMSAYAYQEGCFVSSGLYRHMNPTGQLRPDGERLLGRKRRAGSNGTESSIQKGGRVERPGR